MCTRAGGKPARDRQRGVAIRTQICVPHRIAIDGRIIERWQIDRRFHIGGDNAAAHAMQRYMFCFGNWRNALTE